MDSILNQEDDEIYVYCSASKEDAVKVRKRQVTAERLAIMFNVKLISTFAYLRFQLINLMMCFDVFLKLYL